MSDSPNSHSKKNYSSNNSKRLGFKPGRRKHAPRVLSGPQVVQRYLSLMDTHLTNRKKYFENYDRDNGRHRDKLENNFFQSIEDIRRFEAKLNNWQWAFLKKNLIDRYRLDHTYSSNHEINPMAEYVEDEGDFEDPHLKPEQIEAIKFFAEDKEDSSGTYEDYLNYQKSKPSK